MGAVMVLRFVLPFVMLVGIAAEFARGRGVLGGDGIRAGFTVLSVALLAITVIYCLGCLYAARNYDRNFGFGIIVFPLNLAPTLILAVILLVLHYWRTGPA